MIINMNGAKAPETPSPVLQEKTVTPETLPTVIGPDAGYDGLSQVTVNPDAQLKAENIRSGKTIFGVTGAFVGEPQPSNYTASDIVMTPSIVNNYSTITCKTPPIDLNDSKYEEGSFTTTRINKRIFSFVVVGNEAFSTSALNMLSAETTQKLTVTIPEYTPEFSVIIRNDILSSSGWWNLPNGTEANITAEVKRFAGLASAIYNAPEFCEVVDVGTFTATSVVSGREVGSFDFTIATQPEHTLDCYRSGTQYRYAMEWYYLERLTIKVIG